MSLPRFMLFRATALAHEGEPEATDRLALLPRPLDWLGLAMLVLLAAAALGWGWFGQVARSAGGSGLLIAEGGRLVEAQAGAAGVVEAVEARPGAAVEAGAVLLRLAAADRDSRLSSATALLAERRAELARVREGIGRVAARRDATEREQRRALEARLAAGQAQVQARRQQSANTQALRDRGYATVPQLNLARAELAQAEGEVAGALTALAELEARLAEEARGEEERLSRAVEAVSAAERGLAETAAERGAGAVLRAPQAGRVVELRAGPGRVVAAGEVLALIEAGQPGIELAGTIPARLARELRPGMAARLLPAGARREEHGEMLAEVVEVSDFPLSLAALRGALPNEALVEAAQKAGPVHLVRLRPLRGGDGGYRWSAPQGAAMPVASGAVAGFTVVTGQARPVALVLPALRRWLEF
ncbi:NHLP bacteriocin system secretion protein [Roseomonas sp. 18066]|uniref:NHLP bacteriocin system secretion protein n=1 Tax=Roseomonas sp. 18066 TaxID=2681412 RepID=UPI00135B2E0B|nr:NHLP bacteriocin system secretion protein [Roseomonas sp. 18066]